MLLSLANKATFLIHCYKFSTTICLFGGKREVQVYCRPEHDCWLPRIISANLYVCIFFNHASIAALWMAMSICRSSSLVQKYLNNYCKEIVCRHSWFPEDSSWLWSPDFSSNTMTLTFVLMSNMSQQVLDHFFVISSLWMHGNCFSDQ